MACRTSRACRTTITVRRTFLSRNFLTTVVLVGAVWFAAPAGAQSAQPSRLGPYAIKLLGTPATPSANGTARLVFAESPFGIAVTADGRSRYDVEITADSLPAPSTLGPYAVYMAWAATPDLNHWTRLGAVGNGKATVGSIDFNKFLLVVAAESSATSSHAGPTVLHGTSPSGWMQSFLAHPLFRGIPQ